MPAMVRDLSDTDNERSSPPASGKRDSQTKKPRRDHTNQTTSPKTRLPSEAKRKIAQGIIQVGSAGIDFNKLAKETGLTTQQVRSQVVDNRQNVRKQLMDLAKALA